MPRIVSCFALSQSWHHHYTRMQDAGSKGCALLPEAPPAFIIRFVYRKLISLTELIILCSIRIKIRDISYFAEIKIMKTIKNKKRLSSYLSESAYRDLFPRSMDEAALLQSAAPGEVLLRQGEEPVSFMFLSRGRCSVSCTLPDGKTILLKTISAPSMLGEMELISPERSALTVRALEECSLIVFPMKISRALLLEDNEFLRKLCTELGNKERLSVLKFFIHSAYPLDRRLAAFILEQREGEYFRIRKVQAAQTLGVSYRHLETVINRFLREGILSKDKLTYHIEDEEALRQLSKEMDEII